MLYMYILCICIFFLYIYIHIHITCTIPICYDCVCNPARPGGRVRRRCLRVDAALPCAPRVRRHLSPSASGVRGGAAGGTWSPGSSFFWLDGRIWSKHVLPIMRRYWQLSGLPARKTGWEGLSKHDGDECECAASRMLQCTCYIRTNFKYDCR